MKVGKLLGWNNKSDLIKEEGMSQKYSGCKVTCHHKMNDASSIAEKDNDWLSKHSDFLKLLFWHATV